jgi:hypothetical protein
LGKFLNEEGWLTGAVAEQQPNYKCLPFYLFFILCFLATTNTAAALSIWQDMMENTQKLARTTMVGPTPIKGKPHEKTPSKKI